MTLRGNGDQVKAELRNELINRLQVAGITVDECGFTHLAYASETAGAMLRRQQAQAVVAARKTLVEGAVGMVEMALDMLSSKKSSSWTPNAGLHWSRTSWWCCAASAIRSRSSTPEHSIKQGAETRVGQLVMVFEDVGEQGVFTVIVRIARPLDDAGAGCDLVHARARSPADKTTSRRHVPAARLGRQTAPDRREILTDCIRRSLEHFSGKLEAIGPKSWVTKGLSTSGIPATGCREDDLFAWQCKGVDRHLIGTRVGLVGLHTISRQDCSNMPLRPALSIAASSMRSVMLDRNPNRIPASRNARRPGGTSG